MRKCNVAYSYIEHGYDLAMEEMKKQCELAWQCLSKIHVYTWETWAMDTNCKTDLVNNNLSEVCTRYIFDVRSRPIVSQLGSMKGKWSGLMVKREGEKLQGVKSLPSYA
jgi:hypothetical protein